MNFFTELSNRWTKESPKFQKKLVSFGLWLLSAGTALIGVPAAMTEIIPKEVNFDLSLLGTISSYMILAGLVISAVAKTAVKDPDYKTLDK